MKYSVPERVILLLCGKEGYELGLAYCHLGQVSLTGHRTEADYSVYTAEVLGSHNQVYLTTAEIDSDNDVKAECDCPVYVHGGPFCKHIAAVLIHALGMEEEESLEYSMAGPASLPSSTEHPEIAARDQQLVNNLLGVFSNTRQRPSGSGNFVETRAALAVEFICKPFTRGYGQHMLGLEMKLGPKRLYIVTKIRELLERIESGKPYTFSKHFTYDPSLHSFLKEDNEVLQQLISILQNERIYRDKFSSAPSFPGMTATERLLPIPPFFWDKLLPLLSSAPNVRIQQGEKLTEGIRVLEEALPLSFQFKQAEETGYLLEVQGLEHIRVLEEYGLVMSEGRLLKLPARECKRLAELKGMLEASRRGDIWIAPEQMEPFMDKVIPGLKKLGEVQIADSISRRIVQGKLKARLYLDRVRDRLLAGLEFQYGDVILNPLDEQAQRRSTELILIRDGDSEARILALMENAAFSKTESGYLMRDEDNEYNFLYHTVPLLEELLEIYATTAVKQRLYTGTRAPKATLQWNEKMDWLDFKFDMNGIPETEVVHILQSLQEKRKYYRLPDGALLPLESEEFQEIIAFINELGLNAEELKKAEFSLPLMRGLHLSAETGNGDAVKLGRSLRRLLANMQNPENLDFPVPGSLVPVLRDYQQYGFQWLKTLAHYRFGGILADDMGLGKTLQSITFLLSELEDIRAKQLPALIVAPASLTYNWLNELKKFAPKIRVAIADGNLIERRRTLKNAEKADVIITSYPLLRRDAALYAKKSFHTLFLDEAQVIKNHVTQTAQAAKALQARYRFALTGTPVENKLEDLWSIFSIVFPELFPGLKGFHDLPRETIARRARPFLLRRLKSDVLKELPDKIESIQASELLPEQKKLYVAYLARLQKEALKHLTNDGFNSNRIRILAGLTRLRQLCCHPSLFIDGYSGGSAKFEQLLEIIEECRSSGKRMLVFSQFTEMLGLIGRELGLQGVPHFYLDGSTPSSRRVELCSRFNSGERDLFLISLKAGGTGLNLTGADTVILYDLWWNPAVEQQAADRAHRIGQKNVVQVIRLVTQGTVEETMYELQQKKKNLIDEVIQPGQEALTTLSEQDIREILMI
ncbi:DEAD/DEAH box helicase [Paenibacillus albidus]|uniref:DEAD/DEAH box helicase n=1 Tax=Paenibacillus albidus TaxID=2041023 RepID=UPI001BEABF94|nr:DEAD/DEAH box helicase [Paenibacillus albidus]MBT2290602.1 DEAD/DEAH box helicase [Paenibacillus albidus]